jgi:hypothetical protein
MRELFQVRHIKDSIVIAEEGQLPRCEKCGILQKNVGVTHQSSKHCIKWTKQKTEREMDIVNKTTIANIVFTINGIPLKQVNEFKYLGWVLERSDNDWPAINRNVKRARMAWGQLSKMLTVEIADTKAMATIYEAVVQAVLLYGAESWVLMAAMIQKLETFHHRCAHFITGQHIRENPDGS